MIQLLFDIFWQAFFNIIGWFNHQSSEICAIEKISKHQSFPPPSHWSVAVMHGRSISRSWRGCRDDWFDPFGVLAIDARDMHRWGKKNSKKVCFFFVLGRCRRFQGSGKLV